MRKEQDKTASPLRRKLKVETEKNRFFLWTIFEAGNIIEAKKIIRIATKVSAIKVVCNRREQIIH